MTCFVMYSLRIRCVKTFAVNNFTVPLSNKRSDKEKFYSVVLMWSLLFFLYYRYRIGDVVKVVGFHNQCPVVEFQYRYVMTHSSCACFFSDLHRMNCTSWTF